MRTQIVLTVAAISISGCSDDASSTTGTEVGETSGDTSPGDGDGDGESTTGDGDGDAPGDGDGDAPGDGDGDGEPIEPCGAFSAGSEFLVCSATYLGGDGVDGVRDLAIAGDGTILYAGSLVGTELGTSPIDLGGDSGALVRLSPDGRELLSLTRLGGEVTGVAAHGDTIIAAGDFGLVALDSGATSLVWSVELAQTPTQLAVASDGTIAVLAGDVHLFDAQGGALTSFSGGSGQKNDLAIDGPSQTVMVTGFKQDDGPPCSQLQIPFIRAYDYAGVSKWTAYDWNKDQVGASSECADSRGMALAIGGDGKLYYAGESHGGNTVHRRLPKDLAEFAPVEKFDAYNDPYNLNGAAPITFYARFDPATGAIELGQFLCTRLTSNDKGNAARPTAIAATPDGHVIVLGGSACCVEDGAIKTVNGEPSFGEYLGGGFALVVSPNFDERLSWISFRGPSGNGDNAVQVATDGVHVAVAFEQDHDDGTEAWPMLTFDAIMAEPGGGQRDGWLGVFPAP